VRIHAIQTGTVQIHERQRRGVGPGPVRPLMALLDRTFSEPLPILAWAIEHPEGVIVVDTGETARVTEPGYFPRSNPYFKLAVRLSVSAEQEIGPSLRALGIEPGDVRTVVMTHLHTDHAGGLHHFEGVEIAVSRREYAIASGRLAVLRGYLPHRWPHWLAPSLLDGDERLTEAGDVRVLPTPGHTYGHMSVLIDEGDVQILIAGDASYSQALMLEDVIDGVGPDPAAARATLGRLRTLVAERPTVYLPTHDPDSVRRLAAREPVGPAD
jgi:N-acyl homoserine lactone hydrolase